MSRPAPTRSGSPSIRPMALSILLLLLLGTLPTVGALASTSITSDEFDGTSLDPMWSVVDPVGDATVATTGGNLVISLPGGVSHNLWRPDRSVKVLQPAPDADLSVEAALESTLDSKFQMMGIVAVQGAGHLVRYDVFHDGASPRIHAATFVDGKPNARFNNRIAAMPRALRMDRGGDTWSLTYTLDGATWVEAGTFTHSLAVTAVGPWAGNHGTSSSEPPPLDAAFGHFRSLADGGGGGGDDTTAPVLSAISVSPGSTDATVTWNTDEPADSRAVWGEDTSYGNAVSDPTLVTDHTLGLDSLNCETTYHLAVSSTDASGNTTTSGDVAFATTACPAGGSQGPEIDIWHGQEQTFGARATPNHHVNVVGRITDPDGIGSASFSVNGGAWQELALGPNKRRLWGTGDINAQIPTSSLAAGPNQVRIQATDATGTTSTVAVEVSRVTGLTAGLPSNATWDTASVTEAAQVLDGHWALVSGKVRTVETGYDRILQVGEPTWADYEVQVPITVHSHHRRGMVGLGLRWGGYSSSSFDDVNLHQAWWPLGAWAIYNWRGTTEAFELQPERTTTVVDTSGARVQDGQTWILRARVTSLPDDAARYRLRFWKATDPEPSTWQLVADQPTDGTTAGAIILVAHRVDASFGTVEMRPVPGEG